MPLTLNNRPNQIALVRVAKNGKVFDQTANLAAEVGRYLWTHRAGADAEPVPDLEFDQTVGL